MKNILKNKNKNCRLNLEYIHIFKAHLLQTKYSLQSKLTQVKMSKSCSISSGVLRVLVLHHPIALLQSRNCSLDRFHSDLPSCRLHVQPHLHQRQSL